jgi:ribosomal protein S4
MVKVVNIASYSVKPGQIVGVREKAKSLEVIEAACRFQSQQVSLDGMG